MDRTILQILSLLQLVMLVTSLSAPSTAPAPGPSLAPDSPSSPAPKIDTHCHYVPPFYKALLNSHNVTAGGLPIPIWSASTHLAANALVGVETCVLSPSTPGAKLDDAIEDGRILARQLNEYAHNLTLEYPKKFLFFASLTLPDLDGAVAEAIYALDTLGAAGVIIYASAFGTLLGTPTWAPLYKVLDERSTVVFVHPSASPCYPAPPYLPNSTLPAYMVDFLLDTTRAAINLVYRNVTRDYPNITFILAHSGGFLPFAAVRAADSLAILTNSETGSAEEEFIAQMAQFHVDLALSASPYSLPSTTAFFNSDKITYGSDYPYTPVIGVEQNVQNLLNYRLHNSARRKIDYNNAYGLFKKFLK